MLYETILSKLGSRMSLNFRPQEGRVYYSPLGRYYDGPLDLRLGIKVGEEVRCLPFTGQYLHFAEIEQHLTMTSVLYRATWREQNLRVEFEFISPFYPQDARLSTAPFFYLRVSVQSFGQPQTSEPPEQVEVLVEMDWDAAAAGAGGLKTQVEEQSLRRQWHVNLGDTEIGEANSYHQIEQAEMEMDCEDLLVAKGPGLATSEQGCRFIMQPDGPGAEIIWVGYTAAPVLEVHGEPTPFKYTEFFHSVDEVLAFAQQEREEILTRTRLFDSLFTEASFTAAERDLHAFGFQSYLANTWWTRRPEGRDWYSVWEGCCLYHSTVDLEYNLATFYLLFWPYLLELELDAWADFVHPHDEVAGKYLNHDIGVRETIGQQHYPHQMEVEENCNYLLMLYALWRVTGDEAPVRRNWPVAKDLATYLIDADRSGNGWPQVGVANTVDDASPAVQFSHEQTYLALKTAAALGCVARMVALLEEPDLADQCEAQVIKMNDTLQAEAWLEDHYAVCIDKGLSEVEDPWNPGEKLSEGIIEAGGRIVGWDAYSLYTSLGLLHLLMTDTDLPLSHPERLRQDILRASQESLGPYGCFHSSVDHSNEWISMNLHRDFVAAYLGLDLITPHTGLYWNFELHQNSAYGRGGCFTDTYGGNFLYYYPRGLTSMGMLTALPGMRLDRVAGTLKFRPVRLPLRMPLVQLADWKNMQVPWLEAEISELGANLQITEVDLITDAGLEPEFVD